MKRDESGNLLGYDVWNLLTAYLANPNQSTQTLIIYQYDALGRRIVEINNTAGTRKDLYFNQAGQVIDEIPTGPGNAWRYQYVWSPAGGSLMTERASINASTGAVLGQYNPLQDPPSARSRRWSLAARSGPRDKPLAACRLVISS